MKEVNCNVIKDILPLYVDGMVSDDTKIIVEEHLQGCPSCRKEVELMKSALVLPADCDVSLEDAAVIKGFQKKWRKKKRLIVVLSMIITFVACFTLFQWMNSYEIYIPYDQSKFSITEKVNGDIVVHYYGDTYAGKGVYGSVKSAVMQVDTETGKKRRAIFFYYYDTPWSKYIEPLLSKEGKKEDTWIIGNMADGTDETDRFDDIYYGKFDTWGEYEMYAHQKDIFAASTKVWSRPVDKTNK